MWQSFSHHPGFSRSLLPVQTLSMDSFPDEHVKYIWCVCETFFWCVRSTQRVKGRSSDCTFSHLHKMEITSGFKRNNVLLLAMNSSVVAAPNTLSPHHKSRKDLVKRNKLSQHISFIINRHKHVRDSSTTSSFHTSVSHEKQEDWHLTPDNKVPVRGITISHIEPLAASQLVPLFPLFFFFFSLFFWSMMQTAAVDFNPTCLIAAREHVPAS